LQSKHQKTQRPFLISLNVMAFPPISEQYPLILASSSPRRMRLLTMIGLPFRSFTSNITEKTFGCDPVQISRTLAEKKACQVYPGIRGSWILGADTIVAVNEKILGKPENAEAAKGMLSFLSGKEHRVITGSCVLDPSGAVAHSDAVTTLVRFKKLKKEEIEAYIDTGEPYGKAGSYAIQGIGSFMVEGISGSYTNVVGLPVCALIRALISVGALEAFPFQGPLPDNL